MCAPSHSLHFPTAHTGTGLCNSTKLLARGSLGVGARSRATFVLSKEDLTVHSYDDVASLTVQQCTQDNPRKMESYDTKIPFVELLLGPPSQAVPRLWKFPLRFVLGWPEEILKLPSCSWFWGGILARTFNTGRAQPSSSECQIPELSESKWVITSEQQFSTMSVLKFPQ